MFSFAAIDLTAPVAVRLKTGASLNSFFIGPFPPELLSWPGHCAPRTIRRGHAFLEETTR